MTARYLDPLTEGQWLPRCRFCKTEATPVAAVDAVRVWGEIEALGWMVYQPVPGAPPTPVCPACGAKNARIMEAVARAKKGRKRK